MIIEPDDRFPWEDQYGNEFSDENGKDIGWSNSPDICRGCLRMILPENRKIADGCACNSPRGINHGLVPKNTCTCIICDSEQTGGTRIKILLGN